MINSKKGLTLLITLLALMGTSSATSFASKAVSECAVACPTSSVCTLPNGDPAAGIYYPRTPDIKSSIAGVFSVDANTGSIYYCDVNSDDFLIASPPAGYSGEYGGLGGWDTWYTSNSTTTNGQLTLIETSAQLQGMLFCYHATVTGCKTTSFVSFPESYCTELQTRSCDPEGTVLDSSYNVYWVDPENAVLTECLAPSYTSCQTLISSYQFQFSEGRGQQAVEPYGLAYINGTAPFESPGWQFYISDESCAGNVWTATLGYYGHYGRLSLVTKLNDSLSGIGSSTRGTPNSTQQIFVAETGSCSNTPAQIIDISPSPISISIQTSSVGQTMFLSTCVGQCLGYPEGLRATANSPNAENMFFSLGSQIYSTDNVKR